MTHPHVFTVASGFGLRVIPRAAPYEFAIGPEPHQLDVERNSGGERLFARVVAANGGYTSKIAEGTGSLHEVVDIVSGPAFASWWLETTVYRAPLPAGWRAVVSGDPDQPCMFVLIGPGDAMIFVQTPKNPPTPSRLIAPGQHLYRQGSGARSQWVEVRYEYDQRQWAQRHDIVGLGPVTCIVTAQCPADGLAGTEMIHATVVADIALAET